MMIFTSRLMMVALLITACPVVAQAEGTKPSKQVMDQLPQIQNARRAGQSWSVITNDLNTLGLKTNQTEIQDAVRAGRKARRAKNRQDKQLKMNAANRRLFDMQKPHLFQPASREGVPNKLSRQLSHAQEIKFSYLDLKLWKIGFVQTERSSKDRARGRKEMANLRGKISRLRQKTPSLILKAYGLKTR